MTALSLEDSIPRRLAFGLLGAAAFGAAAGLGHGAAATLHGLWMAPCLFVGGALLATPPLYLASTHAGLRASAEELVSEVSSVLGDTGVALLGLAAPAAYFSATLRTRSAWLLLVAMVAVVGVAAVRSLSHRTLEKGFASLLWTLFALAVGVRLVFALAHQIPSL